MAEEFELGLLALLAAQLGGGALIPEESLYIECPCGVKLDRVPPRRAYGVTTVIRCDGCHQNIGALEPCYHCPRGRTVAHTSGYDLCDNCAQAKAEEQTKKDEENAPKLPDPLKFVRCRCNERMEFIPVRLKYRAPCKCDGCGDAVPRLSYIYHCPKDRADEHRTAHRLFDYCFACAYKRNPTLANGSGGDSSQLQMMLSNNGTRSLSWNGNDKNLPPTNNADEKEKDKDKDKETTTDEDNAEKEAVLDDVAQLDLLKRKLQKRIIQIQQLENELQTLREANKATPATKNTGTQEAKEPEAKNQEKLPHLSILDAILQSELSRLGLPSGPSNAGNHVNEITTELVKLGIRQCAALQWLSSGDMQREKTQDNNNNNNNNNNLSVEQSNGRGIWNHVSLQSLQTMYGKLDLLFKQYDEMSNQVTSLRATCLEYISKKQDDWENWSADEVVDWISAIENGRFLKYDSHLRQVMNERHFQGKHMKTLKFDRLSALGVKDYDDADALMTCVELLVKNNHNQ